MSKIGDPMGPHNLTVHHHSTIIIYFRVIPALTHYSDIVSDITSGSIYGVYILTFYLTFFLAYTLTFHLTFFLTFYLASILTFFLVFYLASLLTFFLASILTFFLASIQAFYLASILTFSLTWAVPTEIWSSLLGEGWRQEGRKAGRKAGRMEGRKEEVTLISSRDAHLAGGGKLSFCKTRWLAHLA